MSSLPGPSGTPTIAFGESDDDVAFSSALEQASMLRRGVVTPTELVELYLRRIERIDPRLNAYVTVVADQALADAGRRADQLKSADAPPFCGVPVSIKDLNDVAGVRTTLGLEARRNHVAEADDYAVGRLRAAGFIVLGKTNAPALGMGCVTEPSAYGPSRNPWDTDRTPGGSSGGAAAALAAGLCPVAHGSDGGGSIRIPASWCGLLGFKPSRGRISNAPQPSSLQGTIGPIAHTVADAAALLDAMSGYDLGDQFWAPAPERPFLDEIGRHAGRLRIAVGTDGRELEGGPADALRRTATLLQEMGHDVVEAEPPSGWTRNLETLTSIMGAGLHAKLQEMGDQTGLDPLVAEIADHGRGVRADDWIRGNDETYARARLATRFFADYDVLLCPTVAKRPPRIGEHRELSAADLFVMWESYVPFTTIWNWAGQPAVSVPAGLDASGLPTSVQLVARPAEDAVLLGLAAQIEEARPWRHLRPAVA